MNVYAQRAARWAEQHPHIRALILVGSQARSEHSSGRWSADQWSDVDLQVFAGDPAPFLEADDWLSMLETPVWLCLPYQPPGGEPERLVILEGGQKVDFHFVPLAELEQMAAGHFLQAVYQHGYQVLVDKDGLAARLPACPYAPPLYTPPTAQAFQHCQEFFWFEALQQAKTLARGDLWAARQGEYRLNQRLGEMLAWHTRAPGSGQGDARHTGRFLLEWVDEATRAALPGLFSRFDLAESWRALQAVTRLFQRLSDEAAAGLGYSATKELAGRILGSMAAINAATATDTANLDDAATRPESLADAHNIMDAIPTLLWTAQPDGVADFCNQSWLSFTGLSQEQIRGDGWMQALHLADADRIQQAWVQARQNEQPYEIEQRLRRWDGEYCWFLSRAMPVRDADGQIFQWYGIDIDITTRKQAEARLSENEARYRTFAEQSFEGITMVDEQGGVIEWNRAIELLTELKREQVLGRPYWEVRLQLTPPEQRHPDAEQAFKTYVLEALRSGQATFLNHTTEGELVTASGERRLFEQYAFPIKTGQGYWIGAVTRDITERKRADEAYRRMINALPVGVAVVQRGYIEWINRAAAGLLGAGQPELLAGAAILKHVDQQWRQRIDEKVLLTAELGEETTPVEGRLLRLDGSSFEAEVTAIAFNYLGKPSILVLFTDITERKRAAEQITRALAEKETLLRELYHRTKNNMSVIISLLDLQAGYHADAHLQAAFSVARERIHSMSLVHQKLYEASDLSRINLKEYLHDLALYLLQCYSVSSRQISFSAEMDDIFVLIDTAIPCGLILNELITNALKHAFPSGQKGHLRLTLHRADSGAIRLELSDDGVGLPPGFDPRQDGRLGLQLVNSLAENQLQARVSFHRAPGVACRLEFEDNLYTRRV